MLRKITLLYIGLSLAFISFSQEVWSLEKCINHARQNNLTLKGAEIAISRAELSEKGSRMARLPRVNASTNFGFQYGRNIDPTTNDFINTRLGFNNISLDANLTAYNGGRINNTIRQSQHDLMAAREDANSTFQNIALQMASAYLNILLAKEQVSIARTALAQSREQLQQIDKRIEAGTVPKADRLDIVAQIARNEQTLVQAENTVEINNITLKNLLELDPEYDLLVDIPEEIMEVDESSMTYTFGIVYTSALNNQPSIRASEARMKSAELSVPIARSDALPRVVIFAGMDTRYSNISNFPNNDPYFDQIDRNFGQTLGAQVSIPIYNNHQTSLSIQNARLGIINSELDNRQAKQTLKADIQNYIANARASQTELAASKKSLEAAKAAYENAEKRYQLGAINTLELTTAKTNLDTAELNVARAKYDFVFRIKILDFYMGKPLNLN